MTQQEKMGGFTLMEILTVIVILAIIAVLSVQMSGYMIERAQRVSCTNNLKNLYAGASAYVADNHSWPQISTANTQDPSYAQAWIDSLKPYQLAPVNWICPSVQRLLNNPDYIQPQDARLDYFATPFDSNPTSPLRYANQPWFIERANVHGDGNLMVFASGRIRSLNDVLRDPPPPQMP